MDTFHEQAIEALTAAASSATKEANKVFEQDENDEDNSLDEDGLKDEEYGPEPQPPSDPSFALLYEYGIKKVGSFCCQLASSQILTYLICS